MESNEKDGNVGIKRNTPTITKVIEMAKKNGAVTWYDKTTDNGGLWITNKSLMAFVKELLK